MRLRRAGAVGIHPRHPAQPRDQDRAAERRADGQQLQDAQKRPAHARPERRGARRYPYEPVRGGYRSGSAAGRLRDRPRGSDRRLRHRLYHARLHPDRRLLRDQGRHHVPGRPDAAGRDRIRRRRDRGRASYQPGAGGLRRPSDPLRDLSRPAGLCRPCAELLRQPPARACGRAGADRHRIPRRRPQPDRGAGLFLSRLPAGAAGDAAGRARESGGGRGLRPLLYERDGEGRAAVYLSGRALPVSAGRQPHAGLFRALPGRGEQQKHGAELAAAV